MGGVESQAATASEFSHTAEFRARFQFDKTYTGQSSTPPSSQDGGSHRLLFGTDFRANESFAAHLSLLHNAGWGANDLGGSEATGHLPTGDAKGILNGTRDSENMILVHQAYGTWMITDDLVMKFGRFSFSFADGSVVGTNDYERNPYSYEGVLFSYDRESLRAMAWAVRFAEWDRLSSGNKTGSYTPVNSPYDNDPESNALGVSLDLKLLPAYFKIFNFYLISHDSDEVFSKNATDTVVANGTLANKNSQVRWGCTLAGGVAGLDLRLYVAQHQGTSKRSAPSTSKTDIDGSMYEMEIGYSFESRWRARVFGRYHLDSGDKDSVGRDETYDPYFYNEHGSTGLMDVLKWGNFTSFTLGTSISPAEDLVLRFLVHSFSRTQANAAVVAGKNGSGFLSNSNGVRLSGAENGAKPVATEADVEMDKQFDGGFGLLARVGYFVPGAYLKHSSINKTDSYLQLFIQGKMTF